MKAQWLYEQEIAQIKGWDFTHIEGRYEQEALPWDYSVIVKKYLKSNLRILDMDTGGGEVILSFSHPYHLTAATEAYPPNVNYCKEKLVPLGIDFREGKANCLPFEDESFDLVLNRHGDFDEKEIHRILKKGGLFITQQVGAYNDRDFVELLYEQVPDLPYSKQHLKLVKPQFETIGFEILEADECFVPMRFFDIGALVWFCCIIQWEFPNFSVENNEKKLWEAQKIIENQGFVEGKVHRFMLVAKKV